MTAWQRVVCFARGHRMRPAAIWPAGADARLYRIINRCSRCGIERPLNLP